MTHTPQITTHPQKLREILSHHLAINLGQIPIQPPKGIEMIKVFRIYVNVLRQAELDYLSKSSSRRVKARAAQTLFGLHLSPLPTICRLLGIDCHQARLKIIEWKMKGKTGDPVFDFLNRPEVVDQYEMGKITHFKFAGEDNGQEESDNIPDI